VVKLILQGILLTPPNSAPPLICQLLNGCWKTQPGDRLTFAEIHSKLKSRRPHSDDQETWTQSTVTYVHLRHNDDNNVVVDPNVEYLQTLPDLPVHHYSNTWKTDKKKRRSFRFLVFSKRRKKSKRNFTKKKPSHFLLKCLTHKKRWERKEKRT
jgi:hypothetical protein